MGIDEKHIKCVNFDLSTEKLLECFPKGTAQAYSTIKRFFIKNGFEHRQYSGYISKKPLSDYQTRLVTRKLAKQCVWLDECMKEFDISNAPPEKTSAKAQIREFIAQQKGEL